MSLSFESQHTPNPEFTPTYIFADQSMPFDELAVEVLQAEPIPDVSETINEVDPTMLNASQQEYLNAVETALQVQAKERIEAIDTEIKQVDSRISDYEFALAKLKRDKRNLIHDQAEAQRETTELHHQYSLISERVREVSAEIKKLGVVDLINELESAEAELTSYLLSLGLDPTEIIKSRNPLDERKAHLVEENENITMDIGSTKNDLFAIKERQRDEQGSVSEARAHAYSVTIARLSQDILEFERQYLLNSERISAYETYQGKLIRLQEIDTLIEELYERFTNMNTELRDLFQRISDLTGMPVYEEEFSYEEVEEIAEDTSFIPPSEKEIQIEANNDPRIPGVALFAARHRPYKA